MKKLSFFLLFLLIFQHVSAQKSDSISHRYVALGIRSSIFQISELQQNILPPNRLLLNIDPVKYIRLEGQFGMYSNTKQLSVSSYPGPPTVMNLHEKSSVAGIGLFGLFPVERTKFFLGVRYIYSPYAKDNLEPSPTGGTMIIVTDKGRINTIAGFIGAEYLFSKWFSVGAEFGLLQMDDVFTPASYPTNPKLNTTNRITESCFVFRFYPY